MTTSTNPPEPAAPPDPVELLKRNSYIGLLVLGAIVGVPIATVAYFFLKLVAEAQQYLFTTLPNDLGFDGAPSWWPAPLLALSGLLVALAIKYLPGNRRPLSGRRFQGQRAGASDRASRGSCWPPSRP